MPSDEFGYIVVSRKLYRTCPFWNERREFSRHEAWEDMIQMAAWKDHQRSVNGAVVTLRRGEFLASVRFLAKRWLWSPARVSRFLKVVTDMDRVAKRNRTTQGDIYLLVNYETYQSNGHGRRDSDETAARQRRDSGETKRKKGNTGKEGKKEERPAVPASLSTPEFLSVWAEYRKHRKQIKHPLTEIAEDRALAKLERMGTDRAIAALDHSMANGWQGIFEPDGNGKRSGKNRPGTDHNDSVDREYIQHMQALHDAGRCAGAPECGACCEEG